MLGGSAASAAPAWPTQPVHMVVGYPPGTSPDMVARLIAEPLARSLGQPVVIDNKPGAGGNLGVELVVNSKGGHTFGITTNGPLTTAKQLYANLPYDPIKDIVPLSLAATSPLVLATSTAVPAASITEFLAYGRSRPQGLLYGSIGNGSGSHLTMELFASKTALRVVQVPYQGYPQVATALVGHEIETAFMAPSGALVQADAGKLKMLGISSAERSPLIPALPTIAEAAGLPGFRAELWVAAFAPAGMPPDIANRLSAEINGILKLPELQEKLMQQGWTAAGGPPEMLGRRIAEDTTLWGQVIAQANVHLD